MAKVTRSARRVSIAEYEENPTRHRITTTKPYEKARLAVGLTRRNEKAQIAELEANLAAQAKRDRDRSVFLAGLAEENGWNKKTAHKHTKQGKRRVYDRSVKVSQKVSA